MGVAAFAILVVVRRHVSLSRRSSAFPSAARISKLTGIKSTTTVYKELDKLEELGWLKKIKEGRKNKYELNEFMFAKSTDPEEREDKVLTLPFDPSSTQQREREIALWEQTGTLPEWSPIKIQNATFHVTINNYNDQSQHIEVKMDENLLEDIKQPWLRRAVKKRIEETASGS